MFSPKSSIIVLNQQETCLKISLEVQKEISFASNTAPHEVPPNNEIKVAVLLSNERSSHDTRGRVDCEKHSQTHEKQQNQFMKNSFVNVRIAGAKIVFSLVWQHQ